MKGRQLVSQPGDGVGLAATCRVLNEVVMPRAVLSGMGYQAAHRIQLVVTGENKLAPAGPAPPLVFLFYLVDKVLHQVKDAVLGPNFLPEVVAGITWFGGAPWRVPGSAEFAPVKGQKARLGALQLCSDENQVWIYGEMGQATPENKERFPGIAVEAVLPDGLLDVLPRKRVLQLGGKKGQPV